MFFWKCFTKRSNNTLSSLITWVYFCRHQIAWKGSLVPWSYMEEKDTMPVRYWCDNIWLSRCQRLWHWQSMLGWGNCLDYLSIWLHRNVHSRTLFLLQKSINNLEITRMWEDHKIGIKSQSKVYILDIFLNSSLPKGFKVGTGNCAFQKQINENCKSTSFLFQESKVYHLCSLLSFKTKSEKMVLFSTNLISKNHLW